MGNTALLAQREILYIELDRIIVNPYQPRKLFDRTKLEELARSIEEYGVLQPISVRLINGCSYELVAGERRLRASKIAGLKEIPAIVVNISDHDSAVLALIENLQRQDLNYIEEAEGFQNLIANYSFTQEQLADNIGKSQSAVANKLRILKLSREIQKILLENDLSERHARALLKLDSVELQKEVLKKVIDQGLTVKRTEQLVASEYRKANMPVKDENERKPRMFIKDIRLFTNTVQQAIAVMNRSGVEIDCDMNQTENGYLINILVHNT
jgi:ParB family chromosome partitioning protein